MKQFTKTLAAAAILSTLAIPGQAMAGAELFGKAHLSFGSVSEDPAAAPETSSTEVASHSSRVGIRGILDTDSSIKVIYRFVWQIDMSDDSSNTQIKSREQFVGLKDSWGEVRIGRYDSPYKTAGKKNVENLSDTWADYNNIINKDHDIRSNDSIGYWGEIGPGKLGIQYGAGDDQAENIQENENDVISLAYDVKMDDIGFALAYQSINETADGADDGSEGTKVVLGYTLGDTKFGIIVESIDNDTTGGVADEDNMLLAVKHTMGKAAIKFAYGVKEMDGVADDATMTAIAYDYKLSKKVSVYGLLASGSDGGLDAASKLSGDGSALVAGIVANF